MKLLARSHRPHEGEALRVVIIDQEQDPDDIAALVINKDGTVSWSTRVGDEASLPVSLRLGPPVPPLVVVVRDPDASNDYTVFDGQVETVDIDLGYLELADPSEFEEWAGGTLRQAKSVEIAHPAAARYIRDQIEQVRSRYDHPYPIDCCEDGCGLHVDHPGLCAPK